MVEKAIVKEGDGGLSYDEARVMESLVVAWNRFVGFSGSISPEDQEAFAAGIHQCQNVLQARVIRRLYPDFWR